MKAFKFVLLLIVVCAMVFGAPQAPRATEAQGVSDVCNLFSSLSDTVSGYNGATAGIEGTPFPGETFTLVVTLEPQASSNIALVGDDDGDPILDGPADAPVTLSYTVPEGGLPAGSIGVGYYMFAGNEGNVNIVASCVPAPAVALPGCDVLVALPSTAVVGAFVSEALLYAEPGVATYPELFLPAGKTAWVLGKNEAGEYYKILWVCQFLWVRVETMGPNYDKVWNGRPLPTDIVE